MKKRTKKEYVKYRISRSKETIAEVPFLIRKGFLQTAVNRIYYACFYSVIALLLKNDITTNTHQGVRRMLGLHFVKTRKMSVELGKFYSGLFEKRQSSDYADFIDCDKPTAEELHHIAKDFISHIEKLLLEK